MDIALIKLGWQYLMANGSDMKQIITVLFLLMNGFLFSQTPKNDPHWQLVWQDDFDTLNSSIWKVENNYDHWGGEPQVYTNRSENVFFSCGSIVLRVKNELYNCPSSAINQWNCVRQYNQSQNPLTPVVPYEYTSGWIESKQAFNTQYGYIEGRIKIPYGYGFWPAFWTFIGDGVSGGNAAEIDIFEMLGSQPHTTMGTNLHTQYPDLINLGQDVLIPSYTNTFRDYGIEWSPTKIIWYVDGIAVRTLRNHGITDPIRIILNLAIEPWALPNNYTPFPSEMHIDYVKVYELDKDCNAAINTCNYNLNTHQNKVKKEIVIGGSGCSNSISVGNNIILRASDGILIKGDFTVPVGAKLYMDVNPCN